MWGWLKGQKRQKVSPVTLEERLTAVEGELRGLKLEWVNTLEQLTRLAGRADASRRWLAEKAGVQPSTPPGNDAQAATLEQIPDLPAPTAANPAAHSNMSRKELLASLRK